MFLKKEKKKKSNMFVNDENEKQKLVEYRKQSIME